MRCVPLVLLALAVLTTGCAQKIWFTQSLREEYELTGATTEAAGKSRKPSGLQYFISQRIILQREATSRREAIDRGRLLVRKGRLVHEVLIRKGTRGVAVGWGEDWVAISFSKGTQLIFERPEVDPSSPGKDRAPAGYFGEELPRGVYELRTRIDPKPTRTLEFQGHTYEVIEGGQAHLKIRKRAFTDRKRNRKVLRGRRL